MELQLDDRGVQFGDSLRGRGRQVFWMTNANQAKIFQATLDDEIGMVRSPIVDNYARRYSEVVVNSSWTIAATSNFPNEAARFINYMVNDWELQEIYDMDIGVPGSTIIQQNLIDGLDLSNPVDVLIEREIYFMQDILNTVEPFAGRPAGYPIVVNDIERTVDEVLAGFITVEQAVDAHFASMEIMLQN
jgi:multiple sugar transport system substrate-binding protein